MWLAVIFPGLGSSAVSLMECISLGHAIFLVFLRLSLERETDQQGCSLVKKERQQVS
jgi:hypothetical protein